MTTYRDRLKHFRCDSLQSTSCFDARWVNLTLLVMYLLLSATCLYYLSSIKVYGIRHKIKLVELSASYTVCLTQSMSKCALREPNMAMLNVRSLKTYLFEGLSTLVIAVQQLRTTASKQLKKCRSLKTTRVWTDELVETISKKLASWFVDWCQAI